MEKGYFLNIVNMEVARVNEEKLSKYGLLHLESGSYSARSTNKDRFIRIEPGDRHYPKSNTCTFRRISNSLASKNLFKDKLKAQMADKC